MESKLKKELMDLGLTDEQIAELERQGVLKYRDMFELNRMVVWLTTNCPFMTAVKIEEKLCDREASISRDPALRMSRQFSPR